MKFPKPLKSLNLVQLRKFSIFLKFGYKIYEITEFSKMYKNTKIMNL